MNEQFIESLPDGINPCIECGIPDYNGEHLEGCSQEDDLETCGVCEDFYISATDSKFPMKCQCNRDDVEKSYKVTFIMDYFTVTTMMNAYGEEQAERLAEAWLDENGLQISKFKVLDIETEWEASF